MKLLLILLLLIGVKVQGQNAVYVLTNSTDDTLIVNFKVASGVTIRYYDSSTNWTIRPGGMAKIYLSQYYISDQTLWVSKKHGHGYWSLPHNTLIEGKDIWIEVNIKDWRFGIEESFPLPAELHISSN